MDGKSSFAWIINAYKSDGDSDDSAPNVSPGRAVGSIGPSRRSETRDRVDENQCVKSRTENRTDISVRDKHHNDRGGKGIGAEDKKISESSRRKRRRSGSNQRSDNEDDKRKRKRRFSETESGSLGLLGESRSNGRDSEERKKDKNIGYELQLKINRLKEEIERAKQEIGLDEKDLRNKSDSSERKASHRKRRSRSGSLDNKSSSRTDHRSESKSFEHQEKSPPTTDDRESQKIVVVKKVEIKDEDDEKDLRKKFQRYGTVVDMVFLRKKSMAFIHYFKHYYAKEAVEQMKGRFYKGHYIKVEFVDENEVKLMTKRKCRYCGLDHQSQSCPDRIKERDSLQKQQSRARSKSIELRFPPNPRHPAANLFDQERSLSPLSNLIVSESLQTGGIRSVSFPPKILRTDLKETSFNHSLGRERVARRMLMMKQTSGVISYSSRDKSLRDFNVLATIGKGSYGQMFKVFDKHREMLKALKKLSMDEVENGLPASAIQELRLLSQIDHLNIAKLLEIITDSQDKNGAKSVAFYFVYDYMNHDLKRLLQSKALQLKTNDFAWFIKQLLSAVGYCHQIGLVHCDIKPSNILINNRGDLKLTQFSFASFYDAKFDSSTSSLKSNRKIPLWYRAPELLLGDKVLKPATDIWSCGCVIGEMFLKKPVFLGSKEDDQLEIISKVCGSPNPSNWPEIASLPMYSIIKKYEDYPRLLHDAFHHIPYMARSLLDQLLIMDPQKRITAEKSLELDWMKGAEFPKMLPMMLMQLSDCHLLLSAKLATESEMQSPSTAKVSVSSYANQIKPGNSGKTVYSESTAEGFSDKVAIKSYSGGSYAQEAKTCQKPLVSDLSGQFGQSRLGVSGESQNKLFVASDDSKRRTFNPRIIDHECQRRAFKPHVIDYDCQSLNLKSDELNKDATESYPERPFAQKAKVCQKPSDIDLRGEFHAMSRLAAGGESKSKLHMTAKESKRYSFNPHIINYECQPSNLKSDDLKKEAQIGVSLNTRADIVSNYSGRDPRLWTEHRTRPFESKSCKADSNQEPVKGPATSSSTKATRTNIQDERTFATAVADLERLRMLRKQLELIGKEKFRLSGTSKIDISDVKNLETQTMKEESLETTRIHFKGSPVSILRKPLDVDNTSLLKAAYQREGKSDEPRRYAFNPRIVEYDQSEGVSTSMPGKKEAYQLQDGMEGSFRSQHGLKSNLLHSYSPLVRSPGEDNYPKSWAKEGLCIRETSGSSSHSAQPTSVSAHISDLYKSPTLNPSENSSFRASNYRTSKSPEEMPEHASCWYSNNLPPSQSTIFSKEMKSTEIHEYEMQSGLGHDQTRNAPNRQYTDDFSIKQEHQQQHSRTSNVYPEAERFNY